MSLASCAASLGLSVTLLESSLNTLDQGISDFPRLTQVLQNTRHFELLPESQVLEAQNDLRDEIGPQRDEILSRAQAALSKLERREYALKSKVCEIADTFCMLMVTERTSRGETATKAVEAKIGFVTDSWSS